MKALNLVGERFGRLMVVSQAQHAGNRIRWNCACDCGKELVVRATHLRTGHTQSCGCYKTDLKASLTHGKSYTVEYRTWAGMIQRCHNKSHPRFRWYGARGIKVCPEWRNSFEQFYADMGPKPPGLTIDRINNNGDYCKNNCRWATHEQQMENRREKCTSKIWTVEGFTGNAKAVAGHFGVSYNSLWKRMKFHKETADLALKYILAHRQLNGLYGRKKIYGLGVTGAGG